MSITSAPQARSRTRRRTAFSAIAYVVYVAAFALLVIHVAWWRPFMAELHRADVPENIAPHHVSAETMRRLGSLRADRAGAFSRFERAKAPGTIRLCAFGDSFTYGDEVAEGHDYPSMLSDLFRTRGAGNVEVLNFGNSWYGFHQAYILWDDVGRRFDCDRILLGPDCFQPDRDTTFNHTNLARPYYLHARYVLDRDAGVRLVEVIGDTPSERLDGYFRFLSPWRYLRYDRNPPPLLRSILGPDRTIASPLYYSAEPAQAEALATYEILLRRMADEGVPVLLLHSLRPIVEMANAIGSADLVAMELPRDARFPNSAPGGHYSSFGNRVVAEHYFALLGPEGSATALTFTDVDRVRSPATTTPPRPLSDYTSIELRIDGRPAGLFAISSPDPARRTGTVTDLRDTTIAGLVALRAPGTPITDAVFIPVSSVPADGQALVARSTGPRGPRESTIGRLERIDPALNIAVVDIAGLELDAGRIAVLHDGDARSMVLVLGTETLLSGPVSGPVVVLERSGPPARELRVGATQFADPDRLGDSGIVTLHATDAHGADLEIPLTRWTKSSREIERPPRELQVEISIGRGRAVERSRPGR